MNKQYFAESCHIWYRSKTFCFLSSRDVACFANSEDPIQRYLFGSVAQLELLDTCLYSIALDELHSVPKLRSLVVRIPAYNIEGMFPGKKIPWLDAFSDIELAASYYVQQLLAIRGLRTIEFRWGDSNEFKKPQHHVKWAAFKAQLETLVRDVVTQPREKEKSIRTMTLDEALKAKKSEVANKWQTPVAKAPPSETPPLSKTDIPTSEAEMLRLCLSRPAALFNWIRDVADNGVNS